MSSSKKKAKADSAVSGRASTVYRTLATEKTRGLMIIRAAIIKAKGRIDLAASELKVSSRTLSRWLDLPGLQQLRHYASTLRKANNIPGPRPCLRS